MLKVLIGVWIFSRITIAFGNELPVLNLDLHPSVISEKLTQQTVRQTFQDSKGMLWFVTQEGLNRYIGHELENYRYSTKSAASLPANVITRIIEDTHHDIWISSLGGGLARYN